MALPRNLAFDEVIDETWVDAVVDTLSDLSPSVGGVVYGVNMYDVALGAGYALTTVATSILTQAMPAAPAGTLLDLSMSIYTSVAVGIGNGFFNFRINGVTAATPTTVVPDLTAVMSYAGRLVNVAAPVGVPYNVEIMAAKAAAGGVCTALASHTHLSVVSYRP